MRRSLSKTSDFYGCRCLWFLYPQIDRKLCVSCGKCKKVCAFQKENEAYTPLAVYALARKNADMLKLSSSGGAFSVFAEQLIAEQGAVFGVALVQEASTLVPRHCVATSLEELAPREGQNMYNPAWGILLYRQSSFLNQGRKFYSLEHHAKSLR